jgi:hypothetical protein
MNLSVFQIIVFLLMEEFCKWILSHSLAILHTADRKYLLVISQASFLVTY